MITLPSGLTVECDAEQVSDGYHTFGELYAHRCILFAALCRAHEALAWKSLTHSDGSSFDGWFIAGLRLPTGDITYHLPLKMWDTLRIPVLKSAPEWDGHTSADVVKRLTEWVSLK